MRSESRSGSARRCARRRRQGGYYLLEESDGVLSSLGLFETADQAEESGKLASKWINDEHFENVIPNAPRITNGKVVARGNGASVS